MVTVSMTNTLTMEMGSVFEAWPTTLGERTGLLTKCPYSISLLSTESQKKYA
jgi:hypothetical protein